MFLLLATVLLTFADIKLQTAARSKNMKPLRKDTGFSNRSSGKVMCCGMRFSRELINISDTDMYVEMYLHLCGYQDVQTKIFIFILILILGHDGALSLGRQRQDEPSSCHGHSRSTSGGSDNSCSKAREPVDFGHIDDSIGVGSGWKSRFPALTCEHILQYQHGRRCKIFLNVRRPSN